MLVAVCVKWVDLRPEVDRVHGTVRSAGGAAGAGWGLSEADRAAVEVAIRLGGGWGAAVAVVCAGPTAAEPALRELLAAGVDRALRVDTGGDEASHAVAVELASVLSAGQLGAEVVVCGDYSPDRGSGTVPAFLAHHLHAAQALGLVTVEPVAEGRVRAVRRLDGGRREVLEVSAPMVLSVEGSVAELRRAPLAATLAAGDRPVEVRPGRPVHHVEPPRTRPWRPPPRVVAAPAGEQALDRVVQLTGALVERNPPRTVELESAAAAREILEQLRAWGYLGDDGN